MPWTVLLAFAYGIATIVLGVFAFVHKHSTASLIAGGLTGLLAVVGAYVAKSHHPRIGFGIVGFVALATLGQFGMKFMKSKEIYPDGTITLLAIVGLVAAVAGFMGAAK